MGITNDDFFDADMMKTQFPESPLPENEKIIYIKNGIMLKRYKDEFHNCAAYYLNQLINEDKYMYIYKNKKDKAMILIERHNNKWIINQIYKPFNKEVSKTVREYVENWLNGHDN